MRSWNEQLTAANARQRNIGRGDIVRSFDFPGSRDDCYIEGVVTAKDDEVVTIHVSRDVHNGQEQQLGTRLVVKVQLNTLWDAEAVPGVFLLAKRRNEKAAAS